MTLIVEWGATGFADNRALIGASAAALAATLTRAPIGLGVAFVIGVCGVVLAWRSRHDAMRAGWPRARRRARAAGRTRRGQLGEVRHLVLRAGWTTAAVAQRPVAGRLVRREQRQLLLHEVPVDHHRPVPAAGRDPLRASDPVHPLRTRGRESSLVSAPGEHTGIVAHADGHVAPAVGRGRGGVAAPPSGADSGCSSSPAPRSAALPTFAIGFLANRYLIDMLPPLAVAGAIGIWVLVADREIVRVGSVPGAGGVGHVGQRVARDVDAGAEVTGFHRSALSPRRMGLLRSCARAGRHRRRAPVPRDGVVGLEFDDQGRCIGVYSAEQGVWATIEGTDTDTYVPREGSGDANAPVRTPRHAPLTRTGGQLVTDWCQTISVLHR